MSMPRPQKAHEWKADTSNHELGDHQASSGARGSSQSLLEHLKSVAGDRLDSYLADQPDRLAQVKKHLR